MTIKWMTHPKHGRYPCTSSDFDLYKKAGWTEEEAKVKVKPVEEPAFDPNAIVMSSDDDFPVDEPKKSAPKKKR